MNRETKEKKKANKFLMFRLITALTTIIIAFFPMLFLPLRWNFPHMYAITNWLMLTAAKIKVHNMSEYNYSQDGPVLFASNHKSFADPIIVSKHINKPFVYTMGQHVMDKVILFRIVAAKMGFIGIDKTSYTGLLKSFTKIKKAISKGYSPIYFPEGYYTLDKPVGDLRGGIAKIAKETRVKISPVALYNISQDFAYNKLITKDVYIKIGKPLLYSEYNSDKKFTQALTSSIEQLYLEMEEKLNTMNSKN